MRVKRKNRKDSLSSVAFYQEMEFRELDEFKMISYLRSFKLFKIGASRKITNILIKKDSLLRGQVRSFDYRYVISTGKSSVPYNQTVFWANSKSLGLPAFDMKPETFLHKIGTFFGMSDIDFEGFPQFSDQYLLQSKDEETVRDFFEDRVFHFFSRETGWHIEADNFYFIMYKSNKLVQPEDYSNFLEVCHEIYDIFRNISKVRDEFLRTPFKPSQVEEE